MRTTTSTRAHRTPATHRSGLLLAATAAAALILASCSGAGDEVSPSASTQAPTATGTTTEAPTSEQPTQEPEVGCAPTDVGTPEGADVVRMGDVDRDGEPDEAWLTGGADRAFGITTASGATFSTPIDSASPQPASALVAKVGPEQTPIALVDTGRSVALYVLSGCAVTATENAQGEPYTFEKGFTGYGTGVGCVEEGGALRLAGLNAVSEDDGQTFEVTRTFVELSPDGDRAENGETEVVAEGAGPNDPAVTTAQETSCGQLVAGQDGPVEPQ